MTEDQIERVLNDHKAGRISTSVALDRLKSLPFEDLGFANVDHHRLLRQGYPEIIFGAGKTEGQIVGLVGAMLKNDHNILVTRTTRAVFESVQRLAPDAEFYDRCGAVGITRDKRTWGKGTVLVMSAGTSDIPVVEEAMATLKIMGNPTDVVYDVGVAGIHRLLDRRDRVAAARVVIVVAGMEGALPSVVGGLVAVPVIAVPTSVGYGASFGGLAALLGMLNSCASNVAVVNIDNGHGAAVVASLINRL